MAKEREVREPRQKRSMEKKEKILEAAYRLFCEKGYYKTSTPEIALEAQVSIGCLYSYFTDKQMIFLALYDRFEENFDRIREEFGEKLSNSSDPPQWLRRFVEMLIQIHRESVDFIREIDLLRLSDPELAERSLQQREKVRKSAYDYLLRSPCRPNVPDPEAAALVIMDFINALVDRVALNDNPIDEDRILQEGLTALTRYLMPQTPVAAQKQPEATP